MLILALDRVKDLAAGQVAALYLMLYTLGRFFIEMLRTDPATMIFGEVRINVVVSAVVFAAAVAVFVAITRKVRRDPDTGLKTQ